MPKSILFDMILERSRISFDFRYRDRGEEIEPLQGYRVVGFAVYEYPFHCFPLGLLELSEVSLRGVPDCTTI